jgi:hypothetical protein
MWHHVKIISDGIAKDSSLQMPDPKDKDTTVPPDDKHNIPEDMNLMPCG